MELDCWDDPSNGYPVVYHGFTLTSKIPFQDVISCVKGYVGANPDTLPICLSLENHCSHTFQSMMADILHKELEGRLYIPDSSGLLPSPLDLVGRVIIKGKRPPEEDDNDFTASPKTSFEDESVELGAGDIKPAAPQSPTMPKIVPELVKLTLLNG